MPKTYRLWIKLLKDGERSQHWHYGIYYKNEEPPCGGLAIYPWFYSVSCSVMGYKVRWCSLFQMQFRAIAGFSFKHTDRVNSKIIYEPTKMTQQKTQEVSPAALIEWKSTVTSS